MSKLRIVLALALIVLISTSAGAQSVWDGGAGTDNWNDADNWSPDGIPAAGDTAQFAGASPYAVTVGSPSTVGTLSFTAGDYTLGGTGDLTMSTLLSSSGVNALDTKLAGTLSGSSISGGTLSLNNTENTLSGSISVEAGATLVAKADDSGSSLGTATAVLNGGTLTARSLLPPLPTGTLAYWDMEATDAGAVIDASGNGNNATINGDASLVAGAGGKYGQAATFDGSGDYLEVETDLLKNLQQDYTIATWFNLGSSSSYPRLWSNKMNNYNDPRGISIEHKNTEELAVWAGDSKVTNGADGLDVGNWHHVAVTIDKLDGGGHEVVVTYDGTQVASETLDDGDMQDSENFFSLARQAFGGDDYDGLLDDFIVLDRVLTQTEIQDLMAGIGGGPVAAAGEFGNDIDLTADSEIVAEGDVNFGSLTMDAGTTLTTSAYDANGGSVTFTDTTPAGNAGFVANVDTALGALALQDNATITKSGAAILAATTATLNGSAAFDVTGGDVVLGATTAGGTLSKSGAGTLSLSDLGNSLSGANLVINDGTLLTDSNAATTSIVGASVTLDGGTLSLGGDGVYANTMTVLSESAIAAEGAPTLSSTITATGMTLNKTGAGNLHLTDTSNNVAVWNIQEGGLWVDANGNQPTAVQGSLIKLTGDGTTMVFDNVQPNDTTATVTNDVLVELADGESARISTDRPGEDSWNHVVIDGTVTAGTADGTGTATLVLRSGRRSKTIVNGALNLTSDLVLDVQSRETNGRGAIHGGIHDGGNGYDLVFDSSTNDYLPGLMDIDGNSTASGTLTMIGGNDGGNAGQLRLLNPGEWSNVVVDGSDVEMLVYDPNAFASTATVTLRNGGSIGAMYDVPASSDAAPAELSINVEKFIVEATGGELYMPNSGSSDDGFIIGDTDLNGRLTIASGGGGNAIGGGLAGTLTLAQDTTADTAVYTTSNHNGDDFIWAKITDGAGTAGNALRLGASGKAALNIFDPNSDYAGGTIIEAGGSKVIAMEDASLGTGDLTVLSGGRIILRDAADNLAPGATVLVENGAAVGVDTNQDITGQIDAASAGVYAVEGTYTHDIDQSTLGNGEMFVGSIDGGEVTGQVLAGADDTIRLGGGDTAGNLGRLTITGDDRLTGTSSVQIGGSAAELGAGNGTYVEINGNNSYTGGTDVVSGTLAIAGGVTPFGSGDVNVYSGATIAASGSDGTFVGYAGGEIVINPGATLLLDGNPRP
ncbi:MAG: beta strand repeat-containing protein, partial [Phycisphaerae bacterium]